MPDYKREKAAGGIVAGVDEAGRGPLAGPVMAAAVVLDPRSLGRRLRRDLDDSKVVAPAKRAELYHELVRTACIATGQASVAEIDVFNILEATMLAMARAVAALAMPPDVVLVDGNRAPAIGCRSECVIGGDGLSLSIAAASIVAKVTRDRLMAMLAADHPGYGWEHNMGYGTPEHLKALERLGVTPHHRRSFYPVIKILHPDASISLDIESASLANPLNPFGS